MRKLAAPPSLMEVMKVSNSLYDIDFTRSLPPPLKNDPKILALANAIAGQLQSTANQIKENIIYARIDQLDERVLDILAYDLKVEWYDSTFTLAEKRSIVKDAIKVHRRKGTKYAVETALSAIYPKTSVLEWFKYGGLPYKFKLLIDATYENIDPEKHARVIEKVNYYKNLRSHLEAIEYTVKSGTASTYSAAAPVSIHLKMTAEVKVYGLGE